VTTMPIGRGSSQRISSMHGRSASTVNMAELAQLQMELDMADMGDPLDSVEEASSPDRVAMKQHAIQSVLQARRLSKRNESLHSAAPAPAAAATADHDATFGSVRVRALSHIASPVAATPRRPGTPPQQSQRAGTAGPAAPLQHVGTAGPATPLGGRSRRASVTATDVAAEPTYTVTAAALAERRGGHLYSKAAQQRDENKRKTGMSVLLRW
jgi:hypothetical protein